MKRTPTKPTREIEISEFRGRCVSLLDEVSKTRTPLRVTRRGKALVDVLPPVPDQVDRSWIGSMKGKLQITGDITSPVIDKRAIEALKKTKRTSADK